MAKSRNLKVDILLGLKGKGIDEAIKDTNKLGKSIQGLSGAAIKAAAGFAVFKGGQLFGRFTKESVKSATDLQRNIAAVGAIFENQAPAMLEYAQNASRIGLNMNEAAQAATFLGSVIKQAGFSISETSEMTQTLIDLSADLAITYQRDVSEALNAIAALFRGEYDPIEKFGVGMKQNEIESLKAERGLAKLTGRAEIFADVMVRYEQLLIRSSDAQGQFAAQADSLYAIQQVLAAEFENVQAVVGMKLTPSLAALGANMIPLVERFTPVLISLFESLIPVIESLTANKDKLGNILIRTVLLFGNLIDLIFKATAFVIDNINAIKNLAIAFGAIVVGVKLFGLLITGIQGAAVAANLLNITLGKTSRQLKRLKFAIAATGFGLIAAGIGFVASKIMEATSDLDEGLEDIETEFDDFDISSYLGDLDGITAAQETFNDSLDETAGAAGAAKDAVGDFFRNLQNEAAKQSAKLQLEALGASEGLIQAVLGSGDEWYKVFAEVTRRGAESIREVQALFAATPAGFDEAKQAFEEQKREFEAFRDAANEARDSLIEFTEEFRILPTIERQMGKFERNTVDQLENIEERLDEAFDNGYLLENSYRELREYARNEFQVLRQIERQRDELLVRRNAAEQLIGQVSDAVVSGGRLVDVLRDVQDGAEEVDVTKLVKKTIEDADGLREFEVLITSAVVEPIEEVKSKSQQLVAGYRNIVERTRAFVNNMKALRQLGLDPQLFNELVEAGVDAGGATAEALLEGGADTVNEVNSLFGELNALGEELGEETAQVMYGQGEMFVDGIVEGLEAQAAQLEEQAINLAGAFTQSFEALLISGIEIAIAKAQVALGKMPTMEGMPKFTGGDPDGTPSDPGDPSSPSVPAFATPATVQSMVEKRRQEVEDMRGALKKAQSDARVQAAREKSGTREAVSRLEAADPSRFGNVTVQASGMAAGNSAAKIMQSYVNKASSNPTTFRSTRQLSSYRITSGPRT